MTKPIRTIHIIIGGLLLFHAIYAKGQTPYEQVGLASFYADKFEGRSTASGEPYKASEMTCAHMTLPFGTWLEVTDPVSGKSVQVKVNDRGPFSPNRLIDVSRAAAERLGFVDKGVLRVKVKEISAPAPRSGDTTRQVQLQQPDDSGKNEVRLPPPGYMPPPPPPAPRSQASVEAPRPSSTKNAEGATVASYVVTISLAKKGQFGVQLMTLQEVDNLQKFLQSNASNGLIVQRLANDGGYKVLAGPYATRKQAESAKGQLSAKYPGCFIVQL